MDARLTCAEHGAEVGDSTFVGIGWASLVGAVADSETEVLVSTEAGHVGRIGTAECWGLIQHVGHAGLLMALSVEARKEDDFGADEGSHGDVLRILEVGRWLQVRQIGDLVQQWHEQGRRRLRCKTSW